MAGADRSGMCKSTSEGDFSSIDLYGAAIQNKMEEEGYQKFYLENDSGTGEIMVCQVFPGIDLVYNDMHLGYCNMEQKAAPGILEINYCRQGRCECSFGTQTCCYMSSGDLSLCSLQRRAHRSVFPTAHYHGVTVTIDFAGITEEVKKLLELLSINLLRISEFSGKQDFYIIRASETVNSIFSWLYTDRENIRQSYIRVKLLELLLVLSDLDFDREKRPPVYFSKMQTDCVKQIRSFIIEHIHEHYTIEELAKRFMISPTALKRCFRGVYGESVYAYLRTYRLQTAERLLQENQMPVAEIAAKVGYGNPNKFTSAFHKKYGMTPSEYRKNVQMDRFGFDR